MEFIAPIVVILGVYWLLSQVSVVLASAVTILLISIPVLWSLNELRKAGWGCLSPSNFLWTLGRVAIVVPAFLMVYWTQQGHPLYGLGALLVYTGLSSGAWLSIFGGLLFGASGTDDENIRRGSRVVAARDLDKRTANPNGQDEGDVVIGGVTIPQALEAQHFLISGTTGTGKTQVINGMLRSIRTRRNRAIIADPAGGFYARFGRPGDILLNPFDSRTVPWSPFAEIRADYDCDRIAKAIIPDGVGSSGEWNHYAQTLVAQTMLAMHRTGERSIKRLLYWLTSADAKELGGLLEGTPAAALCAKGNDRMLSSTRGILGTYLGVFQYLPDNGTFSIREWVRDETRKGWLFITYRDDQMGLLRNLVATFLEMAVVEGLSLSEDQQRGLWYVMDEVDSLGKVTSLRAGLTKLRKYGGRCILGLQTISQLRTTYGRDEAQTLLACTSVKCILRAGDAETAKSMEQEIGDQEIERINVNDSVNVSENRHSQGQSTSTQVVRQSAVLASEISGLPDLHGFLKLPGDEVARIAVEYVSMPEINPAYQ